MPELLLCLQKYENRYYTHIMEKLSQLELYIHIHFQYFIIHIIYYEGQQEPQDQSYYFGAPHLNSNSAVSIMVINKHIFWIQNIHVSQERHGVVRQVHIRWVRNQSNNHNNDAICSTVKEPNNLLQLLLAVSSDGKGHSRLIKRCKRIPILLGEQIFTSMDFKCTDNNI